MRKMLMPFALALAVLIGILGFSAAAFSQMPTSNPHWLWQNPKPHGDAILAASFVSPSEGWVAGQTQGVLHTTDGGASWTANRFGPPLGFNNLSFRDSIHGCAVGQSSNSGGWGSDSVIWTTSDGGVTWKQTYFEQDGGGLGAAVFTSKKKGWAVGRYGTVLKTVNGGKSWKKVTVPADVAAYDFTSVAFVDAKHGWAIGCPNQTAPAPTTNLLLRTSNGGSNWTSVHFQMTEATGQLYSISFASLTKGWAAGDFGCVYHTSDGGATWTEQATAPHVNPLIEAYQVLFLDDKKGFVVSDDGYIEATEDGGETWTIVTDQGGSFYALAFADKQRGWAFGNDGVTYGTEDGGKSWDWLSSGSRQPLLACSFADASTGYTVGVSGTALFTSDGGEHWESLDTGTTATLRGVFFTDARTGWVVGDSGMILHTPDGGHTWVPQTSGTDNDLGALYFTDAQHGWAGGAFKTLLHTRDGGATWLTVSVEAPIDIYAIHFADATHGWVVGASRDQTLRTDDGGQTWTTVESDFITGQQILALFSLSFLNAQEGWASGAAQAGLGYSALIAHTTDGGLTWSADRLSALPEQMPRAVVVQEDRHGLAIGEYGLLFATKDGSYWTMQDRPCPSEWFLGMSFPSSSVGYAVGSGGTIIKTKDGGSAEDETAAASSAPAMKPIHHGRNECGPEALRYRNGLWP